jgi:CTP:molybdopterin cytidylyltransferase MocA
MAAFLPYGVDVYLVTGHRQEELRSGIKTRDIHMVENPDYRQGMFTSIRAGLSCLGDGYRAAFIAPVDIPLVSSETVRTLLRAAGENPGRVIHPTFNGKRGHPPLIPSEIFPAITGAQGDASLKSVLYIYKDLALNVEVTDGNILFDIDEPADYEELLRRFRDQETA